MSNELFINAAHEGSRIALIENKKLVEFHHEKPDNQFNVGDIYLGAVKKVVPGLNAAFVDVGHEKDAFLHYHDLGPKFSTLDRFMQRALSNKNATHKLGGIKILPDINKFGKINDVLKKGQRVLVQIAKEPISTKGPRLSCELSFPGRFCVLVPFANTVNVSRKIVNREERKRLQRLMESIKPENFGVIVRTVAEKKEVAELDADLRNILSTWEQGFKAIQTAKPPLKVIGEVNRASAILRDVLNHTFDSIVVDNKELYQEVKSFVKRISPEQEKIVKLYNNKVKIFESFGIEKQLKTLFGRSVALQGGGYLIIEHTEALHVIDVNSGNKSNAGENQEDTALKVNIEAAKELARQLRLRDMGGIIVIDFIDMRKAENRKKVYETMKAEMKSDKSKSTVLPLSKFGLMQITRQRVRPELSITTREECPTCNGTGQIQPSIAVADQIEENIEKVIQNQNESSISVAMHPYLHAYFTKGMMSKRMRMSMKYKAKIKLIRDTSLGLVSYKIFNKNGEEINLEA
ncbi:Rne/Rng family ribonuclease [Hyphobacterium sp. CCMP332]|nr:Rne/Rng family ribonuclease [Hyphobacterium sp. CCMP332]